MFVKTIVQKGKYHDSVRLMLATNEIKKCEGVDEAAIMMGTDLNKEILERVNLITEEASNSLPDHLIIGIRATTEEFLENAFMKVEDILEARSDSEDNSDYRPKSYDMAKKYLKDLNLAIISIPGQYAGKEALKALKKGLNVLLFSDNVSIEEEIEIKKYASENDLFLMGPDCGTAMINNVPLGFCNKVRKGNVGIVAASGTGLQEVMTLVHKFGLGISQAIGTGGRDLSKDVGGIMMLQGIKVLNEDVDTHVIVILSKPPEKSVAKKLMEYVENEVKKPVVINFLGEEIKSIQPNIYNSKTLEDVAFKIAEIENIKIDELKTSDEELRKMADSLKMNLGEEQKFLKGLYSGGTLNSETLLILEDYIGTVYSNKPIRKENRTKNLINEKLNSCIDLGEDEFTIGRPHPMIDTSLREEYFMRNALKEDVAVIILDIVIGYGINDNPAKVFAKRIKEAKKILREKGKDIIVITYVCGTQEDPQNALEQERLLKEAGAITVATNATAARLAGMIIKDRQ